MRSDSGDVGSWTIRIVVNRPRLNRDGCEIFSAGSLGRCQAFWWNVDEDGLWLDGLGASPIRRGGGAGSGAMTGGNV